MCDDCGATNEIQKSSAGALIDSLDYYLEYVSLLMRDQQLHSLRGYRRHPYRIILELDLGCIKCVVHWVAFLPCLEYASPLAE